MDDSLIPGDSMDALLHSPKYHDVKEFLPWFENNFPGAAVMKDIACGLEPKNLAWMPIRNSGLEYSDIEENTEGRSRFSTTTFGMGWY